MGMCLDGSLIWFGFHLGREDEVVRSLAARFQREYQLPARTVLSQGTDPSGYAQTHLNKVVLQFNERPCKTLGFKPPAERFDACVASTG